MERADPLSQKREKRAARCARHLDWRKGRPKLLQSRVHGRIERQHGWFWGQSSRTFRTAGLIFLDRCRAFAADTALSRRPIRNASPQANLSRNAHLETADH